MSGASRKKAIEMLALGGTGAIVWWRREGFHQEPLIGIEPKWHVLTGRLSHRNDPSMSPKDKPVWLALCEYRKSFDERIFEMFPSLRKTAPKLDTRCRSCVDRLADHVAELARQHAELTPEEAARHQEKVSQL